MKWKAAGDVRCNFITGDVSHDCSELNSLTFPPGETKIQSGWQLTAPCQGRISQECGHIRSHCYSPASPALPCRCARGEKAEDGREGGGRTRTGGDTQEDRRRCEDLICFSGIKNTHLIIISLLLPITAFSTLTTAYVGRLSTPS